MTGISRLMASAAVGGLALLGCPHELRAADGAGPVAASVSRVATGFGSIAGVVQDETGTPVGGALVSALGATAAYAVTDQSGRFELKTLSAGSYLLRAHSNGFAASRGQTVDVRPSLRTSSLIGLRRASSQATGSPAHSPAANPTAAGSIPLAVPKASTGPQKNLPVPILPAGLELPVASRETAAAKPSTPPDDPARTEADAPAAKDDDHSELAWRLRHLRRSVLQEATGEIHDPADTSLLPDSNSFDPPAAFGRSEGSPLRVAANLFQSAPISGELNFLTTSSFDNPQQLFNGDMFSRNIAYMSVGAPAGSNADWAVKGALSQADISSWVVAGTYATHGPARHHYDVGLSYATQRYDGGNPAALRDVTDGSRNAGALYGFDTWTVSPAVAIAYGGRYARYDYLENKGLLSPRVSMTLSAGDQFRVITTASRRSIAPGAEEFLPPGDSGIWLPPQRTFSSLINDGTLNAERTTHLEVELERDLGPASTLTFRVFQQYVADQLVTLFGVDLPGLPPANLGHYFVGNYGDVDTHGVTAGIHTVAGRIHGSVDYTMARAQWQGVDDLNYWVLRVPGMPARPDRIHNVSTAIQTDVPETSTRVVVLYRLSNSFARRAVQDDRTIDTRFDVEVHQSLPFMDFSTAKWEMLIGVRNFFRETVADQSMFDELMVSRPPKRIVGGLTMRF